MYLCHLLKGSSLQLVVSLLPGHVQGLLEAGEGHSRPMVSEMEGAKVVATLSQRSRVTKLSGKKLEYMHVKSSSAKGILTE